MKIEVYRKTITKGIIMRSGQFRVQMGVYIDNSEIQAIRLSNLKEEVLFEWSDLNGTHRYVVHDLWNISSYRWIAGFCIFESLHANIRASRAHELYMRNQLQALADDVGVFLEFADTHEVADIDP